MMMAMTSAPASGPRFKVPRAVRTFGSRARRVLRNAPVASSVWDRSQAQGSVALGAAAVRLVPGSLRDAVAPVLRAFPVASALVAASRGRHAESVATLEAAARGGRLDRVVDALVALHRAGIARDVSGERPLAPRTEARLLQEEGEYTRALDRLDAAGDTSSLRAWIAGELGVLEPRFSPRTRACGTGEIRRVAHVVTTSLPVARTGYTLRTQGIAEAQVQRGLSVDVFTRIGFPVDMGRALASPRDEVAGVSYRRLIPSGPLPLAADDRLRLAADLLVAELSDDRPDILHAHSKHDNAQVALAAAATLGLPVVYEARGFLEETWRSRGGSADSERYVLTRQAETACMRHADAIVTLSRSMRDDIVSRGIDADRVHLVPNAVSDRYLAEPPPRGQARRALGLPEGATIVGMTGTLNPYEGLETLVRAAAGLAHPDLLLLIVGDGPAREGLERLAAELGVRARFPGWVPSDSVRGYIAAMDLFCVPRSLTPVTALVPPLKPLEALAMAVPVLVSDLPPLAELVDESGAAWSAPADDPDAWTDRLDGLLRDPGALAETGARGRAWALCERTWRSVAARYQAVYAQARDRAGGAG